MDTVIDEIFDAFHRPHHQDAVRLWRCDEMGKDPHLETPDLASYRPCLEAGLMG